MVCLFETRLHALTIFVPDRALAADSARTTSKPSPCTVAYQSLGPGCVNVVHRCRATNRRRMRAKIGRSRIRIRHRPRSRRVHASMRAHVHGYVCDSWRTDHRTCYQLFGRPAGRAIEKPNHLCYDIPPSCLRGVLSLGPRAPWSATSRPVSLRYIPF